MTTATTSCVLEEIHAKGVDHVRKAKAKAQKGSLLLERLQKKVRKRRSSARKKIQNLVRKHSRPRAVIRPVSKR